MQGYASAGFYVPGKTLEDLQQEVKGYRCRGFTVFKMKIGGASNNYKMRLQYMNHGYFYLTPEENRARIELARRTIGPDKILRELHMGRGRYIKCKRLFHEKQYFYD